MREGDVVGTVTSGAYGYRVDLNLAYAFVDPSLSTVGQELELDLLGELTPVEVIAPSPFDPDFTRMRS